MTIVIAFHSSGFRTFKEFYTLQVRPHWGCAFPHLVSYTRFIELMPWSLMGLWSFLNTCSGEVTGISFVDSTSMTFGLPSAIEVCHPNRSHSHKVFKDLAGWGKSSVCWYFGFKLHLIVNDSRSERLRQRGEILSFALTPGNTDDRKPVPEMAKSLMGKLFGDKGYISQPLFEQLQVTGLELITRRRKNMKKRMQPRRGLLGMCCTKHGLIKLMDKILLRKRAIIESVNDQLKNICQIEHSRHRSRFNFLVNLISGLIAYSYHPNKPCLDLEYKGLEALPSAIF
jgi:Transposase DDE domain